jgi:hypothetical protein
MNYLHCRVSSSSLVIGTLTVRDERFGDVVVYRVTEPCRVDRSTHQGKTNINYTGLETTIATWRTNHELMACVCGKTAKQTIAQPSDSEQSSQCIAVYLYSIVVGLNEFDIM